VPRPPGAQLAQWCIATDTPGITPASTYDRLMGWGAPGLRRVEIAAAAGTVAAALALIGLGWKVAVPLGWDVGAVVFLVSAWLVILRADGTLTQLHATREDETRNIAGLLLLGASVASLLAVGFTLGEAGRRQGGTRLLYIVGALLTIVLAWAVVNTVFTLRYADLHYRVPIGVDFNQLSPADLADYRDFAYLAFTIGMCYQVSDTNLRDRHIRRVVLVHSIISYLFGVTIIAASINLVAGLIQ
jgi:uncharacterized membrane protein